MHGHAVLSPAPEPLRLNLEDMEGKMNDQLYLLLGRLEGKVDAVLSTNAKLESSLAALVVRVDKLEDQGTLAKGKTLGFITAARLGWAAGSAILTFVLTYIIPNIIKVLQHGG